MPKEAWNEIARAKIDLIARRREIMETEHKLKVKFMKAEHNMQMELLNLEKKNKNKNLGEN